MTRWTLIPLLGAVIGLSACSGGAGTTAAGPTASAPDPTSSAPDPAPSPPEILLDPAQVPAGGPWTAARTGDGRWADLEKALVPCGRRVIAPGESEVRFRVFQSAGGVSISELVVSGVDATQVFKRFYAECGAVGEITGEPGPRNVAVHDGKAVIAGFTGDHLIVVSGPATLKELRQIADAATTQVAQSG
jgi:hypothetical protein